MRTTGSHVRLTIFQIFAGCTCGYTMILFDIVMKLSVVINQELGKLDRSAGDGIGGNDISFDFDATRQIITHRC